MAVSIQTIIDSKYAEDSQVFQFVADSTVVIDKFTAVNVSADPEQISVYLTDDGSPSDSSLIIDERTIAPGETYTCPELINHALQAGAGIATLASMANAIVIRASGTVIT